MTRITLSSKTLVDTPKKYCRIILTEDKTAWHRLVEKNDGQLEYRMGMGKRKNLSLRTFRTLVRSIVQNAKIHQLEYIALELDPQGSPKLEVAGRDWFYRTLAENLQLAQYEFKHYKTAKNNSTSLKEILVCGVNSPTEKRSFSVGLTVGVSANIARDIANISGADLTPSGLAKKFTDILGGTKTIVKVLNKNAIKKEKMGLLEAVGKGSNDGPKLIVVEYWGAGKPNKKTATEKPIVLIGKGVTYDSGGLNVKPSGFMHEMHMDKTGGVTVLATMHAIDALGLKKNVVAVVPVVENAISADSMRAGDIAVSMSGKTVEILHTDAEGRLILADAMTYAEKYYHPRVMLDVATLTGASLVALGQLASVVMTKDNDLSALLVKLGEETGDLTWPLPLWSEYRESLKSNRADISNIAVNFSRNAGCIEGGIFLSYFAPKKTPWAHLDIAPRMDSISGDKLAKGATGEPVRLLVRFIEVY